MQQSTRSLTVREPSRAEAATDNVDATPSKNKYNAKKTVIGDETFDSKKEAARWVTLKERELAGEIRGLARQVRMPIEIDDYRVCVYVCDFRYQEQDNNYFWVTIHEDCKGMKTPVYLLKKKLVKAVLGIEILET